ncbi:LuxR C-terminal-related transcriptional regulator [Kribbella sp. NPDC055071]
MYTPRPSTGRLRGRVGEFKSVLDLLDTAAAGHSAILVVDGAPGIGKTRLLAAAEDQATHDGFSLARADADEVLPRHRLARLTKLGVHAERLAARGPVCITVDDAQLADSTTVTALRALPLRLAEYAIVWVLVRRMAGHDPPIDWLLGERGHTDAARIALGPLTDDAVTDMIADVLSARPDSDLLAMARGAAGNPLLVRALLDGLRAEGGVAVAGGRAQLLSGQPPTQVREVVHGWVMQLSPAARHLLDVAASLDGSFAVDELGDLLGWPDEQVRQPLHEAAAADLLVPVEEDVLAFHHDLVRQSVADRVPAAVRTALRRQAAGTRRCSTAPAAAQAIDRQPAADDWDGLTGGERTVAELVAQGLTNREVAARMFLSPHTVSFHLRKVYRKLGIRSRVELTRAFVHRGQGRLADEPSTR